MTRVDKDRKNRSVLSDGEFNLLRAEARGNSFKFLALRNEALLCALRLFGKRRAEFGRSRTSPGLLRTDVWVDTSFINFNFKLLKKHKDKLPETVKKVRVDDPIAHPILDYINYLDGLGENIKYFFPSSKNMFGRYRINYDKCLSSRCVYDVVRQSGDQAGIVVWPHLFRETVGAGEVKNDASIYALAKVMNCLNVTERTAWRYVARHVLSVVQSNEAKKPEP